MHCTGAGCERKSQCARYYMIAPPDGEIHTLESLYSFGSGSLRSDGTEEDNYWCSALGNWRMFIPIVQTNADRIRSMTNEELAAFLSEWAERCLAWYGEYGETLGWLKEPAKEGK